MNSDWKRRSLGEIAEIAYGYTASASVDAIGPQFLRITDIQDDQVDWGSVPHCHIESTAFEKHRLATGDIVFARTGATTGKSFLVVNPPDSVAASYLIRLRVTEKTILPEYVAKYFQTQEYWQNVAHGSVGSAQGGFNASKLAAMQIPIPHQSEQCRIVAILDEALVGIDAAMAIGEQNLANSRELFDSYLEDVFRRTEGWSETTIGRHIKFIDYRGRTPTKTDQGLRLITAKNVKMGFLQIHPQEFVEPASYENWMTRGIPQPGDVLFTTEAPLGNAAQLDTDERVVFAQRVIIMQPDRGTLDPTFLKFMLLSRPMQERIHAQGTGATAKGIKASRLRQIAISFPRALPDQRALVARMEFMEAEVKKLQSIYRSKLSGLAELRQSIFRKAFAGELTAKEAEREMAAA